MDLATSCLFHLHTESGFGMAVAAAKLIGMDIPTLNGMLQVDATSSLIRIYVALRRRRAGFFM